MPFMSPGTTIFLVREWNGKTIFRNALGALTVLHGAFWVRYFVADQATSILPTLGLLAVWAGVGCSTVCRNHKMYAMLLAVGLVCAVTGPGFLRDAAEQLLPEKGLGEEVVRAVFHELDEELVRGLG